MFCLASIEYGESLDWLEEGNKSLPATTSTSIFVYYFNQPGVLRSWELIV